MDNYIKRLRVCILLPKLQIGGAEVQVLHLVKNLDRSRFEVSLCCLQRGEGEMEREAEAAVSSLTWIDFRWRYFPVSFIRLVRYLRRGRFDILHAHLALADSLGRIAGRLAGVPVLLTTEHGKHLWKGRPHLLLERMLLGITDKRICVSRDIYEIRRSREGTPDEKLEYIPNAVDTADFERPGRGRASIMAEFGWDPADPLVVSIGRLVSAKDYPILVDALHLVQRRFADVRALIVGEGDCRPQIAARIGLHELEGAVKLTGSRRDTRDLLAAADLFVLSSVREGLPVSLLEAMASRKAIVATAVGGIPDAVTDGKNGILVPPGSPEALAGAIETLLEDADARRTLGRAAEDEVEHRFSIRITADRIGEIYRDLYRRKRGPVGL
ncbi:MAG: glycosyltransferase [bacterium]|nr:MAG: glycosyltransferase [bacterium]